MNSANKCRSFAEPEQVIRFDLQPKNYTSLICHSTFYPAVEITLSHRGCVSRQRGHDWFCMFWYKTCTIQIIFLLNKSNRHRTHVNERVFQSGQHILMNLMQIAYVYITLVDIAAPETSDIEGIGCMYALRAWESTFKQWDSTFRYYQYHWTKDLPLFGHLLLCRWIDP